MSKRIEILDQIAGGSTDPILVRSKLRYTNNYLPAELSDNDIPPWSAVLAVLPARASEIIDVTPSTPNPIQILVADYPALSENSYIIYRVADSGDKDRQVNFSVKELYSGPDFIGFELFGNDDPDNPGFFAENAEIEFSTPGTAPVGGGGGGGSSDRPAFTNDSAVDAYGLTDINTAYPTAKHGDTVYQPDLGFLYVKLDDSPSGNWDFRSLNLLTDTT